MKSQILLISPPIAQIDTNMVEPDGLVLAALAHVRGFRFATITVGQEIEAEDQDGNHLRAIVERFEGEFLLLRLQHAHGAWSFDAPTHLINDGLPADSGPQASPTVRPVIKPVLV